MHKHLRIASHISVRGNPRRKAFVGAIGVRSDGVVVCSSNGSAGGFAGDGRSVNTKKDRCPSAHAEARLCRKLDYGSVVYVARTRRDDGRLAMAKPCGRCEAALRARGVKRVEYTISDNEFGVMEF